MPRAFGDKSMELCCVMRTAFSQGRCAGRFCRAARPGPGDAALCLRSVGRRGERAFPSAPTPCLCPVPRRICRGRSAQCGTKPDAPSFRQTPGKCVLAADPGIPLLPDVLRPRPTARRKSLRMLAWRSLGRAVVWSSFVRWGRLGSDTEEPQTAWFLPCSPPQTSQQRPACPGQAALRLEAASWAGGLWGPRNVVGKFFAQPRTTATSAVGAGPAGRLR